MFQLVLSQRINTPNKYEDCWLAGEVAARIEVDEEESKVTVVFRLSIQGWRAQFEKKVRQLTYKNI